ncbi:hypothetical protein RB195_006964 [Necator americanus]|uniref:Peptidase, S8/S53 family n=1 Tax=Necator americanus TaxID=51031 RepID=A0ABR1BYN1_NECAM
MALFSTLFIVCLLTSSTLLNSYQYDTFLVNVIEELLNKSSHLKPELFGLEQGDNDRTSDGGDRFAIEVDETDWHKVRDLAESAGFVIEKKLQSFQNVYIARRRSRQKRNVEQIINELITSKSVQWGEPLIPLYRGKRGIFIDPLYEDQLRSWSSTPSMSIPEAWAGGFTGRGVTVAVLDDGVDSQHEELRSSISPELSYNFVEMGADINPKPGKDETHGTRCAGVIVMAANNSKCGVGVAHNARLAVLKVLGEGQYVNDAIEGDSLAFRSDSIDIYSASWGPKDDGRSMERPGLLAQRALQYGTMHCMHTRDRKCPSDHTQRICLKVVLSLLSKGLGLQLGTDCD